MSNLEPIRRRKFLITGAALASTAGCLGQRGDRPGSVDKSDLSVQSNGSVTLTAKNVKNDKMGNGLKISTGDSVTDGKVVSEIPVSISDVSKSTVYVNADVEQLDDDTEVEIRFHSPESSYRSVYIGNEYKNRTNGVLATEPGSNYELREQLQKLPSSEEGEATQIEELNRVQFVIRDGDFIGTVWALWFIFEDMTISIL